MTGALLLYLSIGSHVRLFITIVYGLLHCQTGCYSFWLLVSRQTVCNCIWLLVSMSDWLWQWRTVGYHVRLFVTLVDCLLPWLTVCYYIGWFVTKSNGLWNRRTVCYQVWRFVTRSDGLLPGLALCYQVGRFVKMSEGWWRFVNGSNGFAFSHSKETQIRTSEKGSYCLVVVHLVISSLSTNYTNAVMIFSNEFLGVSKYCKYIDDYDYVFWPFVMLCQVTPCTCSILRIGIILCAKRDEPIMYGHCNVSYTSIGNFSRTLCTHSSFFVIYDRHNV